MFFFKKNDVFFFFDDCFLKIAHFLKKVFGFFKKIDDFFLKIIRCRENTKNVSTADSDRGRLIYPLRVRIDSKFLNLFEESVILIEKRSGNQMQI